MSDTAPGLFRFRLRRPVRVVLAFVLIVASSLYIFRILNDSLILLHRAHYSITTVEAIWLTSGILGTLILSTLYHVLAVRRIESSRTPVTKIGLAYALGQIVRYLPGKVVGLLFQTRFLSGMLRASSITLALIVQTVYDYFWTFVFAGSILLCSLSRNGWPLIALLPVGIGIWWAHLHGWCERGLLFAAPIRRLFGQEQLSQLSKPPHPGLTALTLFGEWIPMLLGIGIALNGNLGLPNAVLVGAIYLLASVGSLLVFVVPSGLVVREALFVWLGSRYGFEPPMLLFLGIVLRASMTLAEALNVGVFFAANALQARFRSDRTLSDSGIQ